MNHIFDVYNSEAHIEMLQGYDQNMILQKLEMPFLGSLFLKIFLLTEMV